MFTTFQKTHSLINNPDIDIILPCYNPVTGWEDVVLERLELLRNRFPGKQIRAILVNDGSAFTRTPASMSKLESKAKDLLLLSYPTNMGKGFAIRTGVQRSGASVIVFTDVDFPYTMDSMVRVINPVLEGTSDVTFAVRNSTYYSQLPAMRKGMSRMLRWINRKVLGLHTSDTQGGLKAFNSSVRDLFLQGKINRYLFDLEFAYLLSVKKNLRVLPVEADLREGIQMSPVRMRILLGESINFLKVLLRRVKK